MYKYLIVLCFLFMHSPAWVNAQSKSIELADPTIFPYENKYYLYGTGETGAAGGFRVYVSKDLLHWTLSDKNEGYALKKGEAYGDKGFWAPQVFQYRRKFYMAYTANEQIAIAESESPLGPFKQKTKLAIPAAVKEIDPFVYFDEGKIYLYHVRLIKGNRIFVAELNDDLTEIKENTLKECIASSLPWENTNKAEWPVAEGPSVLKRGQTYYLFYSSNDFRNPDYAVGYATSDNPLGPWKKFEGNPVISRQMFGTNGPGHGDFFTDKKKQLHYVFHTHNSHEKVGPRKTAIIKTGEPGKAFSVDVKSFHYATSTAAEIK